MLSSNLLSNFCFSLKELWIQVQVYAWNKSYAVSISQVGSFAKTWVKVLVILWRLQLAKNKRQIVMVVNKKERSGGTPDWLTIIVLPYARHYNPRFVLILPHFSLRFIFESIYTTERLVFPRNFSEPQNLHFYCHHKKK